MLSPLLRFSALIAVFAVLSCGNPGAPVVETAGTPDSAAISGIRTASVLYTADTLQCNGYIAYDQRRKEKLPIVVIVHEWWGLTDYVKSRARQLAELGYFAIDADMYGGGRTAADPTSAMAMSKPYYLNPSLALTRVRAAIAKARTFSQADSSRVAAIGYCFGGFVVLNAAKMGLPLKGTVSFHGDLGGPAPRKGAVAGEFLICQGGADEFVPPPAQAAFRKTMDSSGVKYLFMSYPGAMHAFTNPAATALGKKFKLPIAYNPAADSASWKDMKLFFASVLK